VTDIILNLKSIPLKLKGPGPKVMTLRKDGPATATAADLVADGDIEVLDKTIHLAALDKDGVLDAELIVENNRGFITADQNFDETHGLDSIPLDSAHSPVVKVNYRVEPARVGKRIDYEKLTLEIWTTGAVAPVEALAQAAKVMRDHLIIFLDVVDERADSEPSTAKREVPYLHQADLMAKPIEHLELSVRSNNCLRSAGIEKIYELVLKSEDELLKTKNFGRKSLGEIKETLTNLGLGLNLDLNAKLLERIKGETKNETKETDE
jgi:DNA-directed RNA polymerase subunit alpha